VADAARLRYVEHKPYKLAVLATAATVQIPEKRQQYNEENIMNDNREEQVRIRAYDIWEKAGRPYGLDRDHWLQAVSEIEGMRSVARKTTKASVPPKKSQRAASPTASRRRTGAARS
jgi:hypothetical protein